MREDTEPDPRFGRLTRRKWYAMAGAWSIVLVPWLVDSVTSGPWWERLGVCAAIVAYAALYVFALFEVMDRRRPWASAGVLVAQLVLWTVICDGTRGGIGVLYTISFTIVGVVALLPRRAGPVAAVAVLGYAIGIGLLTGGNVEFGDLLGLAAMTLAMIGMFGLIRVNSQLREARGELARLAVTEERERIARDLHDVLGHSLTTITVKTALARRLLEEGDTVRAAAEVADVERLGRQALADVRSTVAANRVASLAHEIAGAREALRAAGIEADLPVAVDDVPPDRQQAFAHVLREGVTNVIRHSGASRCRVRVRPGSIEVCDDGVGAPAAAPAGNGLSGLSERVAAIGGWLENGPRADGGYRLAAVCAPVMQESR
jgi:two-component system, NarL family, sensor histidine kinase DesK